MVAGIWVGGRKVLQSQPIVFDVSNFIHWSKYALLLNSSFIDQQPFILALPGAARAFHASISGSRRLHMPYDQFYAYPCFSSPQIQFEFGGEWKVRVLKGKRDKGTFSPGGRFSMGRMAMGSGYCVGIVVESRMGMKKTSQEDGNELEDVWVLGEPFFRDCQVAFNVRSTSPVSGKNANRRRSALKGSELLGIDCTFNEVH